MQDNKTDEMIIKLLNTMVIASENRTKVADKAMVIGATVLLLSNIIWSIIIVNMFS